MKYLGNGYWDIKDGTIFDTKTQKILLKKTLPATMQFEKSIGNFEFYEGDDFGSFPDKKIIVIIDFCESIRRHKNTITASFTKFSMFDQTHRKYLSIKEDKGWFHFDYKFVPGTAYIMQCQINHEFPDNLMIIYVKEINKINERVSEERQ